MITLVTKNYCPYCTAAKDFIESLWKEYTEVEVSADQELYSKYQEISGMRTVPQVFDGEAIKENLIGGYDDMLAQYNAGKIFQN